MTQGKEDKLKYKQKNCCGAVGVRFPSAYGKDCEKLSNRYKELGKVFTTFLKIGAFTFGGGYAMIPLIQKEAVENHGWITDEDILEIIAIAESTPGPIAINSATFVGYRTCGVLGSVCATLGVVLPSFVLIYAISFVLRQFQELQAVQFAFQGIRAGVLALLCKALWGMYKKNTKNWVSYIIMAGSFLLTGLLGVSVLPVLIGCAVFGLVTAVLMDRRMQK
ncbi:MAG: chromate transporter [Oscillospiraceae bacterium]|nr:chromate transporter [Oscillospiraceae bacterium]